VTERKKSGRSSLSGESWELAALKSLARNGLEAVGIEPLARELGVTKGSGYWHFRDRKALLRAALARWEREVTAGVLARLARIPDPRERFLAMLDLAFLDARNRRLEAAVHASAHDPVVRPFVRRTRDRRIRYLEGEFREMGLPAPEARDSALLAYSAYIGLLSLEWQLPARSLGQEDWERYLRYVADRLLPPAR
jgi:AcrR family transcriptional regulator